MTDRCYFLRVQLPVTLVVGVLIGGTAVDKTVEVLRWAGLISPQLVHRVEVQPPITTKLALFALGVSTTK